MGDNQIEIEVVLASLRETIGAMAQEIAVLKATLASVTKESE